MSLTQWRGLWPPPPPPLRSHSHFQELTPRRKTGRRSVLEHSLQPRLQRREAKGLTEKESSPGKDPLTGCSGGPRSYVSGGTGAGGLGAPLAQVARGTGPGEIAGNLPFWTLFTVSWFIVPIFRGNVNLSIMIRTIKSPGWAGQEESLYPWVSTAPILGEGIRQGQPQPRCPSARQPYVFVLLGSLLPRPARGSWCRRVGVHVLPRAICACCALGTPGRAPHGGFQTAACPTSPALSLLRSEESASAVEPRARSDPPSPGKHILTRCQGHCPHGHLSTVGTGLRPS